MKTILLSLLLITTFSSVSAEEKPITIGAMLCLSGDCAEYGTSALNGVRLAIKEINSSGGILKRKIKLEVQDSQDTSPAKTVSALSKILNNKDINYIIGPSWTIAGLAVAPLIAKNKNIISISPSVGVKEYNETAKNILNIWPHDDIGTRKIAQYAINQGWRKAAVFGSEDPWVLTQSKTFIEEFTRLGGTITTEVKPLPSEVNLLSEALKIKQSKPEFILLSHYQTDIIAKALSKINFNIQKLSILMEETRVKSAEGALEGTIFTMAKPAQAEFRRNYIKKFNIEPGINSANGYDTVMLYAKAITITGSFKVDKILANLLTTKDFSGASGNFSINKLGAADKEPQLWKIKNSEYTSLEN